MKKNHPSDDGLDHTLTGLGPQQPSPDSETGNALIGQTPVPSYPASDRSEYVVAHTRKNALAVVDPTQPKIVLSSKFSEPQQPTPEFELPAVHEEPMAERATRPEIPNNSYRNEPTLVNLDRLKKMSSRRTATRRAYAALAGAGMFAVSAAGALLYSSAKTTQRDELPSEVDTDPSVSFPPGPAPPSVPPAMPPPILATVTPSTPSALPTLETTAMTADPAHSNPPPPKVPYRPNIVRENPFDPPAPKASSKKSNGIIRDVPF